MGAFVMAEVISHLISQRGAKKRQYSAHESQQLVNNHPQIVSRKHSNKMPSAEIASKRQAAREVIDILSEISLLLVRVALSNHEQIAKAQSRIPIWIAARCRCAYH